MIINAEQTQSYSLYTIKKYNNKMQAIKRLTSIRTQDAIRHCKNINTKLFIHPHLSKSQAGGKK
jgi:hypothetical protein